MLEIAWGEGTQKEKCNSEIKTIDLEFLKSFFYVLS